MKEPRSRALQIEREDGFQRREWLVQRGGWIAMVAMMAAGLSGLLGDGRLSGRVAGQAGGPLWIEYQRFGRWSAPERILIHLGPRPAGSSRASAWVDRAFVDLYDIERVTPEPLATFWDAGRLTYLFAAPSPEGELTVVLDVKPLTWGKKTMRIGVPAGPSFALHEIIYP